VANTTLVQDRLSDGNFSANTNDVEKSVDSMKYRLFALRMKAARLSKVSHSIMAAKYCAHVDGDVFTDINTIY
jgi:hypothetical protein